MHERPTIRLRAVVLYSRLIERVMRNHTPAKVLFALSGLRSKLRARLLAGDRRECPCCGRSFSRMAKSLLTGWGGICPACNSFSRHRAIALLLARKQLGNHPKEVLHFAPERLFDPVFGRMPGVKRLTTDLFAPSDLKLDITHMELPDDSFDLVLCSHVLEHVLDDAAAISELHRVARAGGTVLVAVPYRPDEQTFEDGGITEPLERMVAFGQHDHVRVFGADLADRLRAPGFEVRDATAGDLFDTETVERCELSPSEHFFICAVPSKQPAAA